MPESVNLVWLVLVASGGYAIAVVGFFKDWLSVRKLELEIAALKATVEKNDKIIVLATPEEIERFAPRKLRLTDTRVQVSLLVALFGIAGTLAAVLDNRANSEMTARLSAGNDAYRKQIAENREQIAALQQRVETAERQTAVAVDAIKELVLRNEGGGQRQQRGNKQQREEVGREPRATRYRYTQISDEEARSLEMCNAEKDYEADKFPPHSVRCVTHPKVCSSVRFSDPLKGPDGKYHFAYECYVPK